MSSNILFTHSHASYNVTFGAFNSDILDCSMVEKNISLFSFK